MRNTTGTMPSGVVMTGSCGQVSAAFGYETKNEHATRIGTRVDQPAGSGESLRERDAPRLEIDFVGLAGRAERGEAVGRKQRRHHVSRQQRHVLPRIANDGIDAAKNRHCRRE